MVYANYYLRDNAKAEDVVQELFVRLWEDRYLEKNSETGLMSYLFTAVRNSCVTLFTKRDILHDPVQLTGIDIPVEVLVSIDNERIARLMQEIGQLPERLWQVVECVMLRELKYKDAAAELNISVNTVKFLLKQAIRRLRMRLNVSDSYILFLFLIKKIREKSRKRRNGVN